MLNVKYSVRDICSGHWIKGSNTWSIVKYHANKSTEL